ncbi:hypothetical protein I8748_16115 [Nostoc sp. CENA67]|uniref:Uncharacterized protein n=1 Tax=Amazonocrinis nigriterrae CENA67 TaxID=2794033 RepID=A0A8J7HPT7_9NOST|nr:hypothetical protein [Amazonocrinis nigriterrae]MBH8563698.1 hypothetical protein [Amazonocrinis nigriterrae CENA67]
MSINSQNMGKYAKLFGTICGGLLLSVPVIPRAVQAQQSTPSTPKVNPCPKIFYEEPHNNRVLVPQGCPPNAFTQRQAAQGLLPTTPTAANPNPSPSQIQLGVGGEAPQSATPGLNPCPKIYYEEPFNTRNIVPQGCPPNSLSQQQQALSPNSSQVIPVSPSVSPTQPTQPSVLPPRQTPRTTIAFVNGKVNIKLINNTAANVTYEVIGDTAPRSLQGKSDVTLQNLTAPITVTFQRQDGGLLLVTPQPSSEPGMLEVTFQETTDIKADRRALRIEPNGSVYLN